MKNLRKILVRSICEDVYAVYKVSKKGTRSAPKKGTDLVKKGDEYGDTQG